MNDMVYPLKGTHNPDKDSDSSETDTDQWDAKQAKEPLSDAEVESEQRRAQDDPCHLTNLWWAKRRADKLYRAAKGRFGPKSRFKRRTIGRVAT